MRCVLKLYGEGVIERVGAGTYKWVDGLTRVQDQLKRD